MPYYLDPSWVWGDRQKAAMIVCHLMENGASWDEAWLTAETAIYSDLGVTRKQHDPPQNKKEDSRVEEKS
jgi:hypothetical protein